LLSLTYCPDLYRVYVDDESYNYGHGQAYKTFGIDVQRGALIIVRPDQYVSMVTSLEDDDGVASFFQNILKM
jgi:phenol 2-monooxygenase